MYGGKRDMPDPLHEIGDTRSGITPQSNRSAAVEMARLDLAVQLQIVTFEEHASTWLELLAWMHQGFPYFTGCRELEVGSREVTKQQTFHRTAAWDSAADQPGREHTGVVQDEEIARVEMISQAIERCVFDRAGVAWKHQQPRLPTLGRRVLRDQLARKLEIKIAGSQ